MTKDIKKTEIYLFRHGRTLANEKHLYCGKSDVHLSKKGREELLLKKERLDYPDLSKSMIYTSSLSRSWETLNLLYPELAELSQKDKAFNEIDFGDFEMHSYDELKDNKNYQDWVQNEVDRIQKKGDFFLAQACPNGESYTEMNERVLEKLNSLTSRYSSLAIFTHGGVISAIMEHFFPNEDKSLYQWQPDFGSGYKITLTFVQGEWRREYSQIAFQGDK